VLSTQALLESEADLRALRRMTGNGEFAVEANDLGAVGCSHVLARRSSPGPHLNIYNAQHARAGLLRAGATRWAACRSSCLARDSARDAVDSGLPGCRPRCSCSDACRSRSRRAASRHAITA
jgi:collagenase-like PrtC family protease